MTRFFVILSLAVSVVACTGMAGPTTQPTEAEILVITDAYNETWEQLDYEAILARHTDDFDYYFFDVHVPATEFEETLRSVWMAGATSYDIEISDPKVKILGPDAAIASFRFTDVTVYGDFEMPTEGALSYVFVREEGEWLISRIHHSGPIPETFGGE